MFADKFFGSCDNIKIYVFLKFILLNEIWVLVKKTYKKFNQYNLKPTYFIVFFTVNPGKEGPGHKPYVLGITYVILYYHILRQCLLK